MGLERVAVKASMVRRSIQARVHFLAPTKDRFQLWLQARTRRPHERDFLAIRTLDPPPGALYLDVGANFGQSILSIRNVDPTARIIAFEPNVDLLDDVRRYLPDSEAVEIRPVALGAQSEDLTLFIPVYNGWTFHGLASLDRTAAEGWLERDAVLGFDPDKLTTRELPCKVVPLDDLELDPWFVKVDVQSTEAAVIEGAAATLERCHPILMLETTRFEGVVREVLEPLEYQPATFHKGSFRPGDRGALNIFYLPPEHHHRVI